MSQLTDCWQAILGEIIQVIQKIIWGLNFAEEDGTDKKVSGFLRMG